MMSGVRETLGERVNGGCKAPVVHASDLLFNPERPDMNKLFAALIAASFSLGAFAAAPAAAPAAEAASVPAAKAAPAKKSTHVKKVAPAKKADAAAPAPAAAASAAKS